MFFSARLQANIWKYHAFQVLSDFCLFVPILVVFWQSAGLSLTEIFTLQAIYAVMLFALEVPTGAFADRYGRKISLCLGSALLAAAFIVYGLGIGFFHFLIAEIVFAVGETFISGADSAMLYDTLKSLRKEKRYKKIAGRSNAMRLISSAAGAVLGGYVAAFSLRIPFFLSAIPIFIASLIALSLKEPRHYQRIGNYWAHIFRSFRFAFTNKRIRWLMVYFSLIGLMTGVGFLFSQPYMQLTGLDIVYFGIAFALFNIVAAAASHFTEEIEGILGERALLWLMPLLIALSLVLMGAYIAIFGFMIIMIQQVSRGLSAPVQEDYINRHVPSNKRATVLSINYLTAELATAIFLPFFGLMADAYSLQYALTMSGLIILVAAIMIMSKR